MGFLSNQSPDRKKLCLAFILIAIASVAFAQDNNFYGSKINDFNEHPQLRKTFTDFHVFQINSASLKALCSASASSKINLQLGNRKIKSGDR